MKNTILFLCCFLLLGCSSKKKQQVFVIEDISTINLSENVSTVSSLFLSDAVSKVEIVPLEVTDESMLGNIRMLQVTNDDIWVQLYRDEHLFRFSRSGKYLNQVGMIGQGPQEYIRISDFFIDNVRKEIYIVTTTCGVKIYDFEGKFKRIATNILVDDVFKSTYIQHVLYNNKFFIAQNLALLNVPMSHDSVWSFALVDSTFQKKKIFKNPAHIGREEQIIENGVRFDVFANYWMEPLTNIDVYNHQLTLKYPDTDTIYQYDCDKDDLLPLYSISTNEQKGDYEQMHLLFRERKMFDFFSIQFYYQSKDFVYLVGSKGDKILTYCYDKHDGSVRMQERHGEITEKQSVLYKRTFYRIAYKFLLNNDLCGGDFVIDYRSQGRYWVDVLEPGNEEEWIDVDKVKASKVKDETQKQKFINTLEHVEEEGNPILVIATLK